MLVFLPDGSILEDMVIYSNLGVSGKAECIKLNLVDLESSHMAENAFWLKRLVKIDKPLESTSPEGHWATPST